MPLLLRKHAMIVERFFSPPNLINGKNTVAAILCSSGTTGLSKGVSLTHAAILENMVKLM